MYLKSLELAGFKSFAKKTKLAFKTPITAIVGPNGSGKSNVAESFRFVLGEQRMTQMRSKRTEDLIWNGSQKVPRGKHARVELVFDNADGLFDVDFEEVAIERLIHRDASTEYRLNKSAVRLKDIVEVLSSAHIGASGHHIISQGETDRILMVNALERKEMIEDALGLKVYQYKKQEAERKLVRTEQHTNEVESLRRELAPHLKFLKRQVEKVEKAREMRDELRSLYSQYVAAEKTRLATLEEQHAQKRAPLAKELAEVTSKLKKARQTLAHLEDKDEKSEELLSLEQQLSDIRKQKSELAREVGQLEGELRARKRITGGAGATVPASKLVALKKQFAERFERIASSDDITLIKRTIDSIWEEFTTFIERFAHAEGKDEKEYEQVARDKKEKEATLRTLSATEGTLVTSYEKLRSTIESDRDSSREAERAVFTLSARETELNTTLEALKHEEDERVQDRDELAHEQKEAVALIGAVTHDTDHTFADDTERKEMHKHIERLKIRLEDTGAGSGEEVLQEYTDMSTRDTFLEHELADLAHTKEKLMTLITDLDEKLSTLFREGVEAINTRFEKLFALMFGGGHASLELVREESTDDMGEEQEATEGIVISVDLPRKRIKGLHMLSGGERALTSIALLFAMSQVNPPPFIVLDETDAALDEANSKRYGDLIEELAKSSQLILITHNRETMSRAGVLYGITMGKDGVSQLLSVDFEEAAKVAK